MIDRQFDAAAPWLAEARKLIGLAEVVGPRHNPTILGWIKSLGGWFKDDETPWCGTFVAHCMQVAGIARASNWFRAKAWADWGIPVGRLPGAIAVFGRTGGGHVGFLVGQSPDGKWLSILGGNQGNRVSVVMLSADRLIALRWPHGRALPTAALPSLADGTASESEA